MAFRHWVTDQRSGFAVLIVALLSLLVCLLQPQPLSLPAAVTSSTSMVSMSGHSEAQHTAAEHTMAHHHSGTAAVPMPCHSDSAPDDHCQMDQLLPAKSEQLSQLTQGAVFLLLTVLLLPRLVFIRRCAGLPVPIPLPGGPRLHLRLCVLRN